MSLATGKDPLLSGLLDIQRRQVIKVSFIPTPFELRNSNPKLLGISNDGQTTSCSEDSTFCCYVRQADGENEHSREESITS